MNKFKWNSDQDRWEWKSISGTVYNDKNIIPTMITVFNEIIYKVNKLEDDGLENQEVKPETLNNAIDLSKFTLFLRKYNKTQNLSDTDIVYYVAEFLKIDFNLASEAFTDILPTNKFGL